MNETEVFADELDGERIAECYGSVDADEANARLIAAAPELLEALQNALAAGLPVAVQEAALAAIAKATGEQP